MARKTDKKKPSRNVLVVAEKKTKGRGKNKTTEVKAKRGKLGARLYCVLLTPKAKGADRKKAKYSCFGSFEEASVALLAAAPLPANPALAEMLKMQATAGMRGRRRGLRGPVYQDGHFEGETFTDGVEWFASVGRSGQHRPMPGRFRSEAEARAALLRHVGAAPHSSLRGALPAGLRGTPEEHASAAEFWRNEGDITSDLVSRLDHYARAQANSFWAGDALPADRSSLIAVSRSRAEDALEDRVRPWRRHRYAARDDD